MPPSEFCLESLPSASPQSSSWLFYLPYEIWIEIFAQIAPDSPLAFALVCRRWLELSKDPHARARFLMIKHKESVLSLYYAFKYDRPILATTGVPQAMLSLGATIPRFLVQAVDKEAHRHDRRRRNYIPPRLLMFFLTEGYRRFGDDMDYNEDVSDLRRFESALLGTNSHPSVAVTDVRRLITEYGFVPLGNLSASVEEIVYKVSLVDLGLVEVMKRNGLKLAQVNDLVLERVFWRPDFSNSMLSQYLAVGFSLTDEAIKKGLQIARDRTLNVLKEQCSSAKLGRIAVEALRDMMGPMIRGWSFSLEPIDYLYQRFEITEDDMRYILLTKCDPQYSDKEFPATRCYMKVDPCPVWRWVLRIYGPEHVFTQACFDDAISRAVAHRELHQLHNVYVERGIRFYPRHIKILACRVLHRDMTNNALFLFRILKEQALASQIDMDADEKAAWIQALQSEICDNQDWIHRMRTLQLEGGTRGKVYPLQRPPEDGTVFLEEAQELLVALDPPPPTLKRTRSGRSIIQGTRHSARRRESPSVGAGLVKRVQAWFERTE
ncbi:uncharacterized protein BJ171DRAFT_424033 [Polychytrium aggregatum]|uniref:uncharacterized protein n=1 Tax=Polychytrium aggregatum TaxID=110093 RepID=UPI0022FDD16B|nr:uncharacterized protein BJ171DRAFT_424033 [Polychytrium aggregatum]KAI9204566.1 hypothetical protein BJ171DRAFT_424033 [Polychytrium aggregatum]